MSRHTIENSLKSGSYGEFRKRLEIAVNIYGESGLGGTRITKNEIGFTEETKLERAVLSKVLKKAITEGKKLESSGEYDKAARLYSMFSTHPEIFGGNVAASFSKRADIVRGLKKKAGKVA